MPDDTASYHHVTPPGLTPDQLGRLSRYADLALEKTPQDLLQGTRSHVAVAERATANLGTVNLVRCRMIAGCIERTIESWESFNAACKFWLRGAILYFSISNDDDPDFQDFSGFDDDVLVLNACLSFARRADLQVPLDYSSPK